MADQQFQEDAAKVQFSINSKIYKLGSNVPTSTTLLQYIRDYAKLTGAKSVCLEGGCGCCTVVASCYDLETNSQKSFSVLACQTLVYSCSGWSIETIERLGDRYRGYHSLQKAMNGFYGTQCGFCSPGFIMTMYGQLKSNGKLTVEQVEKSLDGNLCRCTGYRPILDAFKSLATDAPENLKKKFTDIEDAYKSTCSKTRQLCKGVCKDKLLGNDAHCSSPLNMNLSIKQRDNQWYRPTNLSGVYKIIQKLKPQEIHRFVVGNTGLGVYKNDGPFNVLIDTTGITDLYFVAKATPLVMGANVSLDRCIKVFKEMAKEFMDYKYLDEIADQWALVANVAVRNVGSWAGNLAMKKQHPEFPSDIFLTLAVVEAVLKIGHSNGSTISEVSVEDYLKTDMSKSIILSMSIPPLKNNTIIKSYKVTPRAVHAHAYVNASFKFEVDPNDGFKLLSKPLLLFGGINPSFIHASETETFLKGKRLGVQPAIVAAAKRLSRDIVPDSKHKDASPTFRVSLSQALFYKAVVNILGPRVNPEFQSAGTLLKRPLSSGQQMFDANKDTWPVGEAIPKLESTIQLSGEAEYTDDIPTLPDELHGAFVQTKYAKAKIKSIDPSKALAEPGVVAFLSASDVPGINQFVSQPFIDPLFSDKETLYCGQSVGIIVAKSRSIAVAATKLVDVVYTDIKKPILTIRETLKNHKEKYEILEEKELIPIEESEGDEAPPDHTLQGEIEMGNQFHFPLEPLAAIVIPMEDGYNVYATTQDPTNTQSRIADVLNIDANSINISVRRIGGGFGMKITRGDVVACAAAVAANKLMKPVRIVLDLTTFMTLVGWRDPYLCNYKIGFDKGGLLKSVAVKFRSDTGFVANDTPALYSVNSIRSVYQSNKWGLLPMNVTTDTAANTYCRTPGTPNAIAVIENIMERIADYLKKDPLEIREKNFSTQPYDGVPIGENLVRTKIVPMLKEQIMYATRKEEINVFNKEHRWKKKGLTVMPMVYNYSYPPSFRYNIQAIIYKHDGSVVLSYGGIEMGQGINTKVAQVAAKALRIPVNLIKVKPVTNITGANSSVTAGSYGTDLCAHGIRICCENLRKRIDVVEAGMEKRNKRKPSWFELIEQCYNREDIDLCERYWTFAKEHPKPYSIWGGVALQIQLDVLTGQYLIERADLIEDCGRSISPYVDVGQVEGAFIMGLGLFSTEQTKFDPDTGEKLTNSTWDYKIPTALDIPVDFRVTFLPNGKNPFGVLSSKATGEPPVCFGYSIVTALREAIKSARADTGDTTWFDIPTPLTVERIQQLCKVDPSQFQLKKMTELEEEFSFVDTDDIPDKVEETNCSVH